MADQNHCSQRRKESEFGMTQDEIIEAAIQGHASTRDAIRWAIQREREACADLCWKNEALTEANFHQLREQLDPIIKKHIGE
jgi:hypothetical protein